jgi:GDSL-like Lipase/Acylhydrolase family
VPPACGLCSGRTRAPGGLGTVNAMSRTARASCALVAAVLLLGAAWPAGATSTAASRTTVRSHTVLQYGDSLAVGTGLFLRGYLHGWTVSQTTSISMHADEGSRTLAALGQALPRVITVSLGTNDDPGAVAAFRRDVREVIHAAGPTRCVIWSTVVRPPYNGVSYDGYNAVLRGAARRYPSFHVFDWQALARAHPQWFGSDGVHPSATGYRVRAAALAKLITSCPRSP